MDDEWAARVEAHLEHCRRCGMEAKTYRELKDALARRRDSGWGEDRQPRPGSLGEPKEVAVVERAGVVALSMGPGGDLGDV